MQYVWGRVKSLTQNCVCCTSCIYRPQDIRTRIRRPKSCKFNAWFKLLGVLICWIGGVQGVRRVWGSSVTFRWVDDQRPPPNWGRRPQPTVSREQPVRWRETTEQYSAIFNCQPSSDSREQNVSPQRTTSFETSCWTSLRENIKHILPVLPSIIIFCHLYSASSDILQVQTARLRRRHESNENRGKLLKVGGNGVFSKQRENV